MSSKIIQHDAKPSGKQIRKALIDLDISVMDLASAMGVSAYYIREIYAERRIARAMRLRIARHLAAEYKKFGYAAPKWANCPQAGTNERKEKVA